MSVGSVARGGSFLFIGTMAAAVLGYVYWILILIVSGANGANVVGTANVVISLSALASGTAILGVPTGVQRFLGREFGHGNIKDLNTYFWSSFVFTLALCLLSAVVIVAIMLLNIPFMGLSQSMLLSAAIIAFLSFSGIMSALLTSIVRTEFVALSTVVSTIAKLSLGVFLVYLGFGWFGAIIGTVIASLSLAASMLFFTSRELKRLGASKISLSLKAMRESMHAGLVSWLPSVLSLIGPQLGILVLYNVQGSFETGTFYIAYAIYAIANTLPSSFTALLLPVVSGSADRGEAVARTVLKVSLALACPLALFLAFYSAFPLSIMPGAYIQLAPTLSVLSLSIIPLTFAYTIGNLVYAHGSYRKAVGIGLANNVPLVILYFVLIPICGQFGVALSYLIGSLIALFAAISVSSSVHFNVPARKITVAFVAPLVATLACFVMLLNWLVGGVVILLTSVFCYGRLGLVERSDLAEIGRAFASEKTLAKAGERLNWLLRIIYGKQ